MKINKISELKTELQKMISNTEKSLQLQVNFIFIFAFLFFFF